MAVIVATGHMSPASWGGSANLSAAQAMGGADVLINNPGGVIPGGGRIPGASTGQGDNGKGKKPPPTTAPAPGGGGN